MARIVNRSVERTLCVVELCTLTFFFFDGLALFDGLNSFFEKV